jgi:hypothetical protein
MLTTPAACLHHIDIFKVLELQKAVEQIKHLPVGKFHEAGVLQPLLVLLNGIVWRLYSCHEIADHNGEHMALLLTRMYTSDSMLPLRTTIYV